MMTKSKRVQTSNSLNQTHIFTSETLGLSGNVSQNDLLSNSFIRLCRQSWTMVMPDYMAFQQHRLVVKTSPRIKLSQSASHFHLRNIRSIRKCLPKRATEQLIHAFVSSILDKGNPLLSGLPATLVSGQN